MAYSSHKLFFPLFAIFFSHTCIHSCNASTTYEIDIRSFCTTTPYPEVCFNSLNISSSIKTSPNINNYLLQSLQVAISETTKLLNLFHNVGHSNIIEKQRGAVQDCRVLHQSTLASLERTLSGISSSNSMNIVDARTYLSAALTNKNTRLEGLDSASGTIKPVQVKSVINTYKHVSNSLSILSNPEMGTPENQPLMGDPKWVSSSDHGLFQDLDGEEYDPSEVLVVAADGTGNFTTITEAINFAPYNSMDRTVIHVKEGIYKENVEIPLFKINLVMLGDGHHVTVITGNRSVGDGWTTFRSATLAVSGNGFLARDIGFENSAGPEKHQAVALRVDADSTAFYRCAIYGYQNTLYCDIYGTIDFIFGNAAVILQACNIVTKTPMPGQFTVITAQSRDSPNENTGISIQNCIIKAAIDLHSTSNSFKSYLGRPWKVYSRTVYLESYIGDFIDPRGWTKWSNNDQQGLDTLYYGEYDNYGPGSSTDNRVEWFGYHVMDYNDAYNFTVSEFINNGKNWLESTFFPYIDGI
ncbi:putative pectinesterase/pectinesterase inhibitor 12, partial [Mucuna pruriens]